MEGDVRASSVSAHGRIAGNIVAQNRVELGATGRVDGDITCKTLVIAEGAVFRGRSVMNGGPSEDR